MNKMPIEDLDFSFRTYDCLKRHGVETVEQLRAMTHGELCAVRNLGKRNMDEINEKLRRK